MTYRLLPLKIHSASNTGSNSLDLVRLYNHLNLKPDSPSRVQYTNLE
jgi:hypothetical protein